ncbi:protoporphyrinogen oxidase [Corynebacterium felinum]|uniref:Coproporphyrinogen III oxidase n=1 Tax=Corynebacterium felinum TaxID=131318 RepID=A0ABU2B976_9CORY|nr:protoporphyrinogen oxidase [Corynebacterium felinum]MDF5819959.1 protoporphyrinogen oxidase [Corynebacterium felinum]MDR7354554.1 oxygen-dependent protoporphyrinogen oxidase [Corynebacterium felinum]WJY93921.1 Protoporphyrinogen oxidase [Corynebacterium felinum]
MRIAIVGAGLAGLTTAWEIRAGAPEAEIDVFEATDRIGGKLFTVPFASGPTDMGAEAYLAFREDATEFFTTLGLKDALRAPSGLPSALYSQGQLHALPSHTVMGIPASSAGLEGLIDADTAARIDSESDAPGIEWTSGEADVSLGALVRSRYGDQVVDRVVSALQGGVYSSLADDLGVRATVPVLAQEFDRMADAGQKVSLSTAVRAIVDRRAASSENATSGEQYRPQLFSTFAGGYAQLYEELAEQSKARIHIDAFVSGIVRKNSGFSLKGAGEGIYDRVVVTTPAPTTAMLLKDVAAAASAELKKVRLASSVVVGMKFAHDEGLPDHSGILVACDEPDVKVKALTFSSKKWPHIGQRGGALVRASFGRFGDEQITRAEEDELVDRALDDLQAITGFDGRAAGLDEIFVQRWFGGLPVYSPEHLVTVSRVMAELDKVDGVFATGSWAGGVGVPAVIAHARAVGRAVIA